MVARMFYLVCCVVLAFNGVFAQAGNCAFQPPFFHMHFGRGDVRDANFSSLPQYRRVEHSCPSDGHYTFASSTSNCFNGDWHTLTEDHTPGDVNGNMLLVNSAYDEGTFFTTKVRSFKPNTTYQFGVWLMNLCRPTKKCPFPLLPNLTIELQTSSGKTVARFLTGELPRVETPHWTQHRAQFTLKSTEPELLLVLTDNAPGGCGNDFALDDITFSECIRPVPATLVKAKVKTSLPTKTKQPVVKAAPKKTPAVRINRSAVTVTDSKTILPQNQQPVRPSVQTEMVPVPLVLKQRSNPLVRRIETEAGEIRIDLYDNGEIDDDTVSIYHNNRMVVEAQRLSKSPISFRLRVDKSQPHHELILVANNLGRIPPNTSVMLVTVNDKRYQVSISSSEQQNARVVIDLKE